MQVIVDSLLTQYTHEGQGKKTILFLHGWADTAKTFVQLRAELSKEYTVIALDLPGFGGSQAPPKAWGLDEYATFVDHFLDKIRHKPYAIVGHSNGGAIALKSLANGQLTASKVVLIASAGVRSTGGQHAHRYVWNVVAKVGKLATVVLPKRVRSKLRSRLYTAAGSDMLVAEHMQDTFKKVVSEDIQSIAERVTVPVLLIYGDQDTATPPAYAHAFAQKLPNATLEIFHGAGHFVHQEQSYGVAQKIKDFLQ